MEKMFKDKLSKYIKEKTGYLEELKVGNIFLKAGWDVRHSNYYLDRDEEKGREIDVYASKNIVFKDSLGKEIYIGLNLVCEVKKSIEKPWVIFSTKKSHYDSFFGFSLYYENNMKNVIAKIIEFNIDRNSSIGSFTRIGETYCEAYINNTQKSGSDYSQIFKSLTSSVKASEYFLSIRGDNAFINALFPKSIELFEPIVIFNGLRCEAYLNEQNELELDEINHIPIFFNRISPKYNRTNYIVDVVTIKELPNLLTSKEKWINLIKENIQE
jgi:hypothetical protein